MIIINIMLDTINVTALHIIIINFKIPIKPDFSIIPAKIVLISVETSTCTANNQK